MKVYYSEKQSTSENNSISPSAQKPELVVDDWLKKEYPVEIVSNFAPLSKDDICLAHDDQYVHDVFNGERNNGFGNRIPAVNKTLFFTNASFYAAAREALDSSSITCSPTSGFHHAGYYGFEGLGYFCTFNGLVIAAQKLIQDDEINRIGIIDLDHHDGNGTRDIIEKMDLKYVEHYSLGEEHNKINKQINSKGNEIYFPSNYDWRGGIYAKEWLKILPEFVAAFEDCDIVFYQAGADPHVDDPYGGALTDEQLRERDRIVFTTLRKADIPIVWNLAGGYLPNIQDTINIHTATLEEALRALEYARET